jgi:hypothetical protein
VLPSYPFALSHLLSSWFPKCSWGWGCLSNFFAFPKLHCSLGSHSGPLWPFQDASGAGPHSHRTSANPGTAHLQQHLVTCSFFFFPPTCYTLAPTYVVFIVFLTWPVLLCPQLVSFIHLYIPRGAGTQKRQKRISSRMKQSTSKVGACVALGLTPQET